MTSMPPTDLGANQSTMAPLPSAVPAKASAAASMAGDQPRVTVIKPGNESYSTPVTNATAANAVAPLAAGAPSSMPSGQPSLNGQAAPMVSAPANPLGSSAAPALAPQPQDPLPSREQQPLTISQPIHDQGAAGEINAPLHAPLLSEGGVGQPMDYAMSNAQGAYIHNNAETEIIICKYSPADGESCNETAIMGGYCKTHYDSLVAEASLLNNLFYSSNASDNSAGESGGEEDEHEDATTPNKVDSKDIPAAQADPMMRCDSLASVAMDWEAEDEKDKTAEVQNKTESQEFVAPQQEATVANDAGGNAKTVPAPAVEPVPLEKTDALASSNEPTQPTAKPNQPTTEPLPPKQSQEPAVPPQKIIVTNVVGGNAPIAPAPAPTPAVEPVPLETTDATNPSDEPTQPTAITNQPSPELRSPSKNKFPNQTAREEATGSPTSIASASSVDSSSKNKDLPAVAIEYLRGWMLSRQHIEQPYPTATMFDKLSADTGVEKARLRTWFVNNRKRLWRPVMDEIRKHHCITDSKALPSAVLDTLDDEPKVAPVSQPTSSYTERERERVSTESYLASKYKSMQARRLTLNQKYDAVAAMMLMTGSRATSPNSSANPSNQGEPKAPQSNEQASKENEGGTNLAPNQTNQPSDQSARTQTVPATGQTSQLKSPPESVPAKTVPHKEHVKFNFSGTIVQVPTAILLKYPESKIADMTRKAMTTEIPYIVPRDYTMFSHCVFYICNDKVELPSNVRRNLFVNEMRYYGLPYVRENIGGGMKGSNAKPIDPTVKRRKSSPTNVAQLNGAAASTSQPAASSSGLAAKSSFDPIPHPSSTASKPFEPKSGESKPPSPSALDLLSSAISASQSWGDDNASRKSRRRSAASKSYATNLKKTNCGKCEACLREDCGTCSSCLDKVKFGGPGKIRKRCIERTCANMSFHSFAKPEQSTDAKSSASTNSVGERSESPFNLSTISSEKRWSENLEYLQPCIDESGYINYNIIPDLEIRSRVRHFVSEQRASYRRRISNERTSMTDERLKILEEANFPFTHKRNKKLKTPEEKSSEEEMSMDSDPTAEDEESIKPARSSLDLLCSIMGDHAPADNFHNENNDGEETAENSAQLGSDDSTITKEEVQEEEETSPTPPAARKRGPRGHSCGECETCLREDCGECRFCLDKPKFGGPNSLKRRCYYRWCVRKGPPPVEYGGTTTSGGSATAVKKPSRSSEEAQMQRELAQIRAELDAKARGLQFGLKTAPQRRSARTIDHLLREVEESESEDDEIVHEHRASESQSEEESDEEMEKVEDESHEFASSGKLSNVAAKKAKAVRNSADLPRGITVRSSGKWQVQLYYAGLSRYIGLFDTREEAAVAYEMARDCCDSFEENPTKDQVKRNLALMRKAAFAGGWYKKNRKQSEDQNDDNSEEVKPKSSRKRDRPAGRYAARSNADTDAGLALSGLRSAQVVTKPVKTVEVKRVSKRAKAIEKKAPPQMPAVYKAVYKPVVVNAEDEARKRKVRSDLYHRAEKLAKELPRGVTVRPSGKWQVQLYYAGKSRYMGVFESKIDAAVAYELARECCDSFRDEGHDDPEIAKKNVLLMRQAAFSFMNDKSSNKKQKSEVMAPAKQFTVVPRSDTNLKQPPERISQRVKREPAKLMSPPEPPIPSKKAFAPKRESPKKTTKATSSKLDQLFAVEEEFGGVGYKFRKQFTDEHGVDLGWFEGEVVDIIPGARKSRKCFFAADGYMEDLSVEELIELQAEEEKAIRDAEKKAKAAKAQAEKEEAERKAKAQAAKEAEKKAKAQAAKEKKKTPPKPKPSPKEQVPDPVVSQFEYPGVTATGEISEIPEIGPGWTVSVVPRKSGERSDYYYFSPTGERFRSQKSAEAQAARDLAKAKKEEAEKKRLQQLAMQARGKMCGECENCTREDCGECRYCLDKAKFGGPNRLKKKCMYRRCILAEPQQPEVEKPQVEPPATKAKTQPPKAKPRKVKEEPKKPKFDAEELKRLEDAKSRDARASRRDSRDNRRSPRGLSPGSPSRKDPPRRGSPAKSSPAKSTSAPQTKRGTACGECQACTREDCGSCVFCKDKAKFGGKNKLRKKCIHRRCPNVVGLGTLGYRFKKQFPDGKWYDGIVVKILNTGNEKDRRCRYADDDFEDLSLAELTTLHQLELRKGMGKGRGKGKQAQKQQEVEGDTSDFQHNDLCETCGQGGELLCCSTCNLVFHLECSRPKLTELPPDDWNCAFCVASGGLLRKISKKEKEEAQAAVEEIEALKEEAQQQKE